MVPLAWSDLIFLVNQVFFVLTFLIVARRLVRERRKSDLDVALLFATMATLLVLPRIAAWLGMPSEVRAVMVTPLILAVPYLMLRLVADFATVPSWALRVAEGVFASQVIAFLFQGSIPFVVISAYAAVPIAWSSVAFVREARRTGGVASRRYAAIATGNAAAVSALVFIVVVTILQVTAEAAAAAGVVLQLCVLAAGTSYLIGFATPHWLRRLWRDAELRSFLSRAPELIALDDTDQVVRELAAGARGAMGFDGVLIGLPAGHGLLRFRGTGADYEAPLEETFSGRAIRAGRAIVSFDPIRDVPARAQLYRERDAKMLVAAPIRVGNETIGALAARSAHASLFASDDLDLCQLLADQAAIVLKNRALLDEQRYQADHDPLTALPNGSVLYRLLEGHVAAGATLALLIIDLDAFAEVNQTFGHPIGDEILVGIAQRLRLVVPEGAELGRWGGDQFVVLLPGQGLAAAEAVATRILASFEQPFVVAEDEIECGVSIGIGVRPDHASDARGLVAAADIALKMAKRSANAYAVHLLEARPWRPYRAALRSDLRRAILDGSIGLAYQPLVSLRSGGLLRLEALARWDHPERGPVPASEFVDLAERTGLIRPLTELILERAMTDAAEWRRALPALRVSVNLSARMFAEAGLIDRIMAKCARTGCAPAGLSLEITESVLMTEPERARLTIARLQELGVTTEVDDFGTGYSSLAYLQRLPVSGLKIDRQFIAAMATDERSDAIVRATIRLAHELGFEVVAEGIEDRGAWELLVASGCDIGQGFYIGRPMPAEAVRGWLNAWIVRAPPRAAAPEPPRRGKRYVLVVDDDPAILSVVSDVLSEHGYAVATAADGEEALSAIAQRRPDALLLDVHMPLLDGETLVHRLRDRGMDLPVVVTTAGPNAERWAERIGASDHLAKPFAIDDLLAVIARVTTEGSPALQ